jgi:hypothetical protein
MSKVKSGAPSRDNKTAATSKGKATAMSKGKTASKLNNNDLM